MSVNERGAEMTISFLQGDPYGFTTIERIRELAETTLGTLAKLYPDEEPSVDEIVRLVETRVMVAGPEASGLADDSDHEEWLKAQKAEIDWLFWERYKIGLGRKGFPPNVVNGIDEITDDLLGRIESPERSGSWDRRGLVVGQVQSGKTANYAGLVCKAADAGYKLIVVMAGIHNSLRAQTQARLDADFLGVDSQTKKRIGVGNLTAGLKGSPKAISITDSSEKGDFSANKGQAITMQLGDIPVIVVIKKNATVLQSFLDWVVQLNATSTMPNQKAIIRNIPMLMIDDEADSASINTGKPEDDPTKINGLVRNILNNFEKSAYVGYTATPYANIFVDDSADHEEVGEDLFPRSFVVGLKPPSNYVGAGTIFGSSDAEPGDVLANGLPVTKPISDHGEWMPDKHKKTLKVSPVLPDSLQEAIRVFILGCAVRNVRGQADKHKSMLIHVTRFTDTQNSVREHVRDFVIPLRDRLQGRDPETMSELEQLWNKEFVAKHPVFVELSENFATEDNGLPTFAEIAAELPAAAAKIDIKAINGKAGEALEYDRNEQGLSVIAVGGDKLSRGLTLEGLMVSYYLRASKMYDTLMQMGRWFGYRPGYLDLCRLYTTDELINWYRDIVAATDELMEEFDNMVAAGETPQTYGLRVRSHPGDLLVTATTKMRNGTKRSLTFSNTVSETIAFHKSEERRQQQFDLGAAFLSTLGEPDGGTGANHVWSGVDVTSILAFLSGFRVHPESRRARPQLWTDYIDLQMQHGELTNWTVVMRSSRSGNSVEFGGRTVVPVLRQDLDHDAASDVYRMKRLLQSDDESHALTGRQLADVRARKTNPTGLNYRMARDDSHGLLILYLAVPGNEGAPVDPVPDPPYVGIGMSFPKSETAQPIEYMVNNTFEQEQLDFDD